MILAKDVMSEHVAVIYEDMLIRQVAHLMLRDRVSSFPVVSEDIGVVGIISITDLFRILDQAYDTDDAVDLKRRVNRFKELPVRDVMSRKVVSISPETTLDEIVHILVDQNVHSFPVMEQKKLVGIVGRHDILNAVFAYD
ncbi:MAG: CBS domain-containing protein [Candidatus Omnitrophica bacterium]|nr:CBS domain-containing protein [Candidatus Omnitrophota bacterium]